MAEGAGLFRPTAATYIRMRNVDFRESAETARAAAIGANPPFKPRQQNRVTPIKTASRRNTIAAISVKRPKIA
jgi:hypothetical protein